MNILSRTVTEVRIVARLLPPVAFARWARGMLLAASDMFRYRSLGPVDRLFGGDFTFRWKGQEILIERSDMGIVREIYGHRCYVSHRDISTARNILDLGCNTGIFTTFALLEAPEARIRAVDAQRDLLQSARNNIARLDSSRVTFECAFVGDMRTDWSLSLREQDPEIREFDIRRYLEAVGHCDFIKCDVEGGEFSVFQGDLSWTDAVGAMAIEVHPEYGDAGELVASLRRAGFRVDIERHGTWGYVFCDRC